MALEVFVPDQVWLAHYPIRYSGCRFDARMTVVRLRDGRLWIHSPGPMNAELRAEISALGEVAYIVAPGTFHHLHVAAARDAFPEAQTHLCPGVEKKRRDLRYDALLGDEAPAGWRADFDQRVIRGSLLMAEVAFFHRASRTLILVNAVESFSDQTPRTNALLRLFFKWMFFMWDNPKPAPEYRISWYRPGLARRSLADILAWEFERVVVSHGDLIEKEARAVVRRAWHAPLRRISWWTVAAGLGVVALVAALVRAVLSAVAAT